MEGTWFVITLGDLIGLVLGVLGLLLIAGIQIAAWWQNRRHRKRGGK